MKVLVTGGREYQDIDTVFDTLDRVLIEYRLQPKDLTIVHGGACGADALADRWARINGAKVCYHLPDYERYGRSAPLHRNTKMIEQHPDLVIAFPGGRGTADMIVKAGQAGVPIWNI